MTDCPSRWAQHPAALSSFHHALRRCAACDRTGCVVPGCRRYRFEPSDSTEDWRTTPASSPARRSWRCRTCGAADAPLG